jgi:hypothetical protein
MKPKLTIGMAVHDDFNGVYFTLQSLRLHHPEAMGQCELVVIDNNPHSAEGKTTQSFMGWIKGDTTARYVPFTEVGGTSAPRNKLFEVAEGDAVLCLDPHVLLQPGAIARLLDWYADDDGTVRDSGYGPMPVGLSGDLFQGPMIYDDLRNRATHFADQWRGEMWGTWATDPRGDPHSDQYQDRPFEIPAQGLGLFTCRKEAWLGFNSSFRGFGGEEWYIHEKFRKAGRKTWCLPWLVWLHRFGRPGGVKYQLQRWDKVRNYVIGHTELGLPLNRVHDHFVRPGAITEEQWIVLTKDPLDPPLKDTGCGSCQHKQAVNRMTVQPSSAPAPRPEIPDTTTLEQMYAGTHEQASFLNEHMPKLRELASQCGSVTEFGFRPLCSTLAFLAGQPKKLRTYMAKDDPVFVNLKKRQGQCDFAYQAGDPVEVEIEETDLLMLDRHHYAARLIDEVERHHKKVRRWIVVAGTERFGGIGDTKGKAGLLSGVRTIVKNHPEWTVVYRVNNNNGLMILSKDDRDKKQPPGLIVKALNFAKATAEHVQAGRTLADDATYEARLEACMVCQHRYFDSCGLCGCPVDKKASWAEQQCPDKPPRWMSLPVVV